MNSRRSTARDCVSSWRRPGQGDQPGPGKSCRRDCDDQCSHGAPLRGSWSAMRVAVSILSCPALAAGHIHQHLVGEEAMTSRVLSHPLRSLHWRRSAPARRRSRATPRRRSPRRMRPKAAAAPARPCRLRRHLRRSRTPSATPTSARPTSTPAGRSTPGSWATASPAPTTPTSMRRARPSSTRWATTSRSTRRSTSWA